MKIKNFVIRKRSITRNSKHLRRKLYVHNGKTVTVMSLTKKVSYKNVEVSCKLLNSGKLLENKLSKINYKKCSF